MHDARTQVMYIIHPDEIDDVEDIMQKIVDEMGKEGVVHRLQVGGVPLHESIISFPRHCPLLDFDSDENCCDAIPVSYLSRSMVDRCSLRIWAFERWRMRWARGRRRQTWGTTS